MPSANHQDRGRIEPGAGGERFADLEFLSNREIDFFVFMTADKRLAVELHSVVEVFTLGHVTEVPLAPSCIPGATNLRGQLITLVDLSPIMGDKRRVKVLFGQAAVLVRWTDLRAGILVDRVLDVCRVEAAKLRRTADSPLVMGLVETPSGPASLLDLGVVLSRVQYESAESASRLIAKETG